MTGAGSPTKRRSHPHPPRTPKEHRPRLRHGRREMITLQWGAFSAHVLLRAIEDVRRRGALTAGVVLSLTGDAIWRSLFLFESLA